MSRDDSPRSILLDGALWTGISRHPGRARRGVLLFNYAVMPIWTRHDATVTVPSLREMTPGEAERALVLAGLDAEMREQPFNPNLQRDRVVDQSPAAQTLRQARPAHLLLRQREPQGARRRCRTW